jgi:uncharacterized protein
MDRQKLLAEIKQRLLSAHGGRLRGVVLYGSEVRGESRPDSDVYVLVLLEGPIDYGRDMRTNIDALYDLVLASERPISAKPVDITAYEAAKYPLYRNAKAEGTGSCSLECSGRPPRPVPDHGALRPFTLPVTTGVATDWTTS